MLDTETQRIIGETSSRYFINRSLERGDLDAEKEGKIFSDQMIVRSGEVVSDVAYPEQKFMLGSITKLFIFRALAQQLHAANISPTAEIFPIHAGLIREVINRGQLAYILSHKETYSPVIRWLEQFNLPEEITNGLMSADINIKDAAISKIADGKLIDWGKADFPKMNLNFVELAHWALQVSADSPLTVAKNYYQQNFGGYVGLQEAVSARIPSLEVTESTADFRHWIQKGPNTVQLNDLTLEFDKFVAEPVKDEFAEAIRANVTNNPLDFGFSISGSEKAQAWQAQGYQVFEKTGFYPTVIWIRNLAEQGLPAHMAISSVVALVAPDGQRFTVGLQMSVEIALPKEDSKEGFPDESSSEYQQYIETVKVKYFEIFRTKLIELIEQTM